MLAGTAALVAAGAGAASASSDADAAAVKSSGAFSGNIGQAPFHTPANGCGNTADAGAALNPAFGNACAAAEIENHYHEGDEHGRGGQEHGGGGGGYRHDNGSRSLLERVGV
nr:chaplin [Streptomyces sp. SID3343]